MSSRGKHRERSRDRDRDKGRDSRRGSSRRRSSSSSSRRDSDRSRDRDRHRRRERDREDGGKRKRSEKSDKDREEALKHSKHSKSRVDYDRQAEIEKKKAQEEEEAFQKRVAEQLEKEAQEKLRLKHLEEAKEKREAILRKHRESEAKKLKAAVKPPPPPAPAAGTSNAKDKEEDDDDDDCFDMFGSDEEDQETSMHRSSSAANVNKTEIRTDAEGYGDLGAGRILGGRYQVVGEAGKGVFSTVVFCKDLKNNNLEVVVKVTRLNEAMKRAGRKEIEYLKLLTQRDPENKYCCVRMLDTFEDQDFLCVVLEAMDVSMRQIVYMYGHGEGLALKAVQYYGKRVLMGLYHMKQCLLIHTDLKLDNLLVDKDRKTLKVADFGSTRRISEFVKGRTEELCPLWYRPPEVILGFSYLSYSIDMWCLGCILWELATGTVLFKGTNLNEQLKKIMQHRGPLPKKMVRTGVDSDAYFAQKDPNQFLEVSIDPVTQRPITTITNVSREPSLSLKEKLFDFFDSASGAERRQVGFLFEVLDRCLTLNPRKRMTCSEALAHPFFNE